MASAEEELNISEELTFVVAVQCPYAQRTWIALNAKGIKYSTAMVDLQNKPAWLFKYNPSGQVPAIIYKDEKGVYSLYESLICNEFVHELPGKPLLPEHAARRAFARIIIDRFGNAGTEAFGGVAFNKDPDALDAKVQALTKELHWLESHINEEGPYFLGSEFTLVDAAIIPWFIRLPVVEEITEFSLFDQFPKLKKWTEFLKTLPEVTGSFYKNNPDLTYEEDLKETYVRYIQSRLAATK